MKKEINHIKQKGTWDCCIASVAMLLDKSYDEVLKKFKKIFPSFKKNGLNDYQITKLLKSFKAKPDIIEAVILNIPCILFLPSKNDDNGSHAVFFCGEKIYDPNYKVPGKKYYRRHLPKKFPKGTQAVVNMNNPVTNNAVKKLAKLNND